MAFETEEEIRVRAAEARAAYLDQEAAIAYRDREAAAAEYRNREAQETESRIRQLRDDETARAKEREEHGRAGKAHGDSDLFDFVLTSISNNIAEQIRKGNQAVERENFGKDRAVVLENFKIEAARRIEAAKNIKELAKTSNDIDIAANKISKQLPESERSAFACDLQPINRDAQFRAERMERDEKIQERIKEHDRSRSR